MEMSDLLKHLDLGNSVAEFDESLEKYFVETDSFRALVENRADVIAGDKGTGKTALFRILKKRYRALPELRDVEVITAFNASGNPVFQRLVHEKPLTEGQYRSVWKAYFLVRSCRGRIRMDAERCSRFLIDGKHPLAKNPAVGCARRIRR